MSSLWSPSSLLSGQLCLTVPSHSLALRTHVPSCPEHPHTSFTLGGAVKSKEAADIRTAHTNPLQSLQVLFTRCSPLTTCLMRNKLLHKQAKNLSRKKNRKAWRPKLEDGLIMQMENQNYLPDMSQPMKGPTEADFSSWTAEILIQGKDFPILCYLHSLLDSPRMCVTRQKQRTIFLHSLSNGKKHYLQA